MMTILLPSHLALENTAVGVPPAPICSFEQSLPSSVQVQTIGAATSPRPARLTVRLAAACLRSQVTPHWSPPPPPPRPPPPPPPPRARPPPPAAPPPPPA